jgi:hypothetical protein
MIRILRETTGVVDGFHYQPHLYYVNESDKLVWFQVCDYSRGLDVYAKPKKFSMARRKFELVGTIPEDKDVAIVEVTSENGNTYQVNTQKKTCSCQGFKFRGKCKHIELALKKVH